jgi:hypothetical protein
LLTTGEAPKHVAVCWTNDGSPSELSIGAVVVPTWVERSSSGNEWIPGTGSTQVLRVYQAGTWLACRTPRAATRRDCPLGNCMCQGGSGASGTVGSKYCSLPSHTDIEAVFHALRKMV